MEEEVKIVQLAKRFQGVETIERCCLGGREEGGETVKRKQSRLCDSCDVTDGSRARQGSRQALTPALKLAPGFIKLVLLLACFVGAIFVYCNFSSRLGSRYCGQLSNWLAYFHPTVCSSKCT